MSHTCVVCAKHTHEPPLRMTTPEAAEYCGVADSTLRYYRHSGIGPRSFNIGAKVLYDRADLDEWLSSLKAASVRGGAQ